MCVIRSMYADVPNHEPSLMLMNCGDGRLPRPSMGSWITYGLGSENQNLPGFIAMCPGGYPIVATQNWRSAFLPGAYQGTYIDTKHTEIEKLIENIRNNAITAGRAAAAARPGAAAERAAPRGPRSTTPQLEAADPVVRAGLPHAGRGGRGVRHRPRAASRCASCTATGMQGRQLLITRRLLERGVRFVQVWSGAGQPWDNHDNLATQHRQLAGEWDQPIAAFLTDLKQRGLFDSTLVIWGGEFGRTPVAELPQLNGRDHNHYGFSMWLAGGGVTRRLRPRRHRRVRLRRRREQGPRPRPARHDPAPAGLRPHEADLPLRRPRLPPDRRARAGGQGIAGVKVIDGPPPAQPVGYLRWASGNSATTLSNAASSLSPPTTSGVRS